MAEPTLRPIAVLHIIVDVVYPHEDGQDIGMQIQHILLPAMGQIGQFVPAESAVVELIARTRMPRFVPRGHERHVRVPINMVQVCLAPLGSGLLIVIDTAPVAIGDAVSDKNHTWPVLSLLIPGKGVGAARATRHQKSP